MPSENIKLKLHILFKSYEIKEPINCSNKVVIKILTTTIFTVLKKPHLKIIDTVIT